MSAAAAAPMVAGAAAAAGAAGAPGAPAAAPAAGWSLSSLIRMLMFYWFVSSFFKSGKTAVEVRDVSTGVVHQPHRAAWPENTPYSMYVFIHDSPELNVNQYTAATLNPRSLLWFEPGLRYGWDSSTSDRALNWSLNIADSWPLQHLHENGTLYAHVYFVRDSTPLFKYRAVGDVAGQEAYTHTHDALVVSSSGKTNPAEGGSSDSTALSSGHAVPSLLAKIPSSQSEGFEERYLVNPGFNPKNIVHRFMNLNIFRPAPKIVDKKNLLGVGGAGMVNVSTELEIKPVVVEQEPEGIEGLSSEDDEDEFLGFEDDEEEVGSKSGKKNGVSTKGKKSVKVPEQPYLSYWKPFLSIRLIPDWTVFPYGGIPAEMKDDYMIDALTDEYAPLVYFDYFWLLKDQLMIVNTTVSDLSLNLTHSPLSLMKWRMECQMETSWKMQQSWGMQEEDGRDSEMFKRMVLDTNIYLLAITFFVSILHMIFDFLAFKNDVTFWKG